MRKNLSALVAAGLLLAGGVAVNLPAPAAPAGAAARPAPVEAAPSPRPTEARELVDGPVGTPDRLEITSIDVDAPVISVGTTPENAQEVPSSLEETGWWRDGAVPGAAGNAVIVGHTASSDDGVFDRLVDVEDGDELLVTGEDGTAGFTVTRSEVVPVADFATVAAEIYRADGPSGLVLMTCGDWNGEEFETTVIVHAEHVGQD